MPTMLRIDDKLERHIANARIHEGLYWELAWVKKALKLNGPQPLVSSAA